MITSAFAAFGVNQYEINLCGTTVILNAPAGLKLPVRYSDSSRQWDAQAQAKVLALGLSSYLAEFSEDGLSHWCTDGVELRGKNQWTLLKHPRYLPFGLVHCGTHWKRPFFSESRPSQYIKDGQWPKMSPWKNNQVVQKVGTVSRWRKWRVVLGQGPGCINLPEGIIFLLPLQNPQLDTFIRLYLRLFSHHS